MFKFLKEVVAGSGSGLKDFPYTVGEPYASAWGSWTHHRGASKDDGSPVSIFSLSGSNPQDRHLVAGRNGVKRLRTAKLIGRGSVGELNCLPKLLLCVTILLVVNIVTNVVIDYQSLLSQKFGFASSKLLSAHISQIVCILLLDCCRWPMHLSYLIKDVFLCYRTVRRPQFSYFYPTL